MQMHLRIKWEKNKMSLITYLSNVEVESLLYDGEKENIISLVVDVSYLR